MEKLNIQTYSASIQVPGYVDFPEFQRLQEEAQAHLSRALWNDAMGTTPKRKELPRWRRYLADRLWAWAIRLNPDLGDY